MSRSPGAMEGAMRVLPQQIGKKLISFLRAWGMSDPHADITAEMMLETDLRGVDSHGISMLPTYDREFRSGRLNLRPVFKTVREGPAVALIDADASLGHPVSVHAMNLAVDKCRETGVAVVSVFNSHHFGAAGCYSRIAADRGAIGMVTASTRGVTLVPTFAAEPVMGTNPPAFAAPAGRNAPFTLERAPTPGAAGKVKVYKLNHRPLPPGWVVDGGGRPVTDPEEAFRYVFERPEGGITPLGGARAVGGHKGYGLAVMVHILGGALSGASFSPIRNRTTSATSSWRSIPAPSAPTAYSRRISTRSSTCSTTRSRPIPPSLCSWPGTRRWRHAASG